MLGDREGCIQAQLAGHIHDIINLQGHAHSHTAWWAQDRSTSASSTSNKILPVCSTCSDQSMIRTGQCPGSPLPT
jgi:hypothetical protein